MTWSIFSSGKVVDLANPRAEDITMHDIIVGLVRAARYNGHTHPANPEWREGRSRLLGQLGLPYMKPTLMADPFDGWGGHVGALRHFPYSVAQHSVLVGMLLPPGPVRLVGLLHDAHEAYIGDITQPAQEAILAELPAKWVNPIKAVKRRVQGAIHEFFGIPTKLAEESGLLVDQADVIALALERALFVHPGGRRWAASDWAAELISDNFGDKGFAARAREVFGPGMPTGSLLGSAWGPSLAGAAFDSITRRHVVEGWKEGWLNKTEVAGYYGREQVSRLGDYVGRF